MVEINSAQSGQISPKPTKNPDHIIYTFHIAALWQVNHKLFAGFELSFRARSESLLSKRQSTQTEVLEASKQQHFKSSRLVAERQLTNCL